MMTRSPISKAIVAVLGLGVLCGVLSVGGCKKIDKQTAELKAETARLGEQLAQAQAQRQTLEQKLETMAVSLAELRTQIQKMAKDPAEPLAVNTQLAEVKAQLAELKTQLAEMIGRWDAAMADAKESRAAIEQLRDQLTAHAEKTDQLQTQIIALQQTIDPPAEEPAAPAADEKTDPDLPIVGFPSMEGYKR